MNYLWSFLIEKDNYIFSFSLGRSRVSGEVKELIGRFELTGRFSLRGMSIFSLLAK
jgi:hypothetical protein